MVCELLLSTKLFKIKPALSPYKAQEIIHKQIKDKLLTPTIAMPKHCTKSHHLEGCNNIFYVTMDSPNHGCQHKHVGRKIATANSEICMHLTLRHHPYGRKWRGTKRPLDESKEESEKVGLKLNIQKIRSWHLVPSLRGKSMGKQWKQWKTIFRGSKISKNHCRW